MVRTDLAHPLQDLEDLSSQRIWYQSMNLIHDVAVRTRLAVIDPVGYQEFLLFVGHGDSPPFTRACMACH